MSTLQEQCKKLLPLIQAGAEGKTLQARNNDTVYIIDAIERFLFFDKNEVKYSCKIVSVKPEPKYVPWESIDEIPEEALNGWWAHTLDRRLVSRILGIEKETKSFHDLVRFSLGPAASYAELCKKYVWSSTCKNPVWHVAGKEVVE